MKNFFKRPARGVIVNTSLNFFRGLGYYKVTDIISNDIIIEKHFQDDQISDNLLGFFGIADYYQYCLENRLRCEDIYCSNKTPVIWAKAKKCNSKCISPEISSYVERALSILRANHFSDRIKVWQTYWQKWDATWNAFNID